MCKKLIFLTSFSLVIGAVLTSVVRADLVAYWRLDEGSGTTASDSSGHGNHGTFNGDPQWVEGYYGGAIEFDGAGDFLDCGSDPSLDLTKWTIAFWLRLNGNAVVYNDDPAATQIARWTEWVIDLQAFAGVDLTSVNTITVGIGTRGSPAVGGSGQMYFDDIQLYR